MYNIFILACTNGLIAYLFPRELNDSFPLCAIPIIGYKICLRLLIVLQEMVEEEVAKRKRKSRNQRDGKKRRKEETFDETEYDIIGDDLMLRAVRPYVHRYETFAKEMAWKKSHWHVSAEFGANPREYYEEAIRRGFITVNGDKVSTDYEIKNGDYIVHEAHRHEPPVVFVPAEKNDCIPGHRCNCCGQARVDSLPSFWSLPLQLAYVYTCKGMRSRKAISGA